MQTGYICLDKNSDSDTFWSKESKEVILCVGQVQSGKTQFIIDKIIEAVEKQDFTCVILLGGINNALLSQTTSRFKQYIINNNLNVDIYELNSFKRISEKRFPDKPFIISALKGASALGKINRILDGVIQRRKTLIIDDESDFASVNNPKSSAIIYRYIHQLYNNMTNGMLAYVTATPFANIMSECSLPPTRLYKINVSNGYTGIDFFCNHQDECFEIENPSPQIFYEDHKYWEEKIINHVKRVYESNLNKTQFIINYSMENNDHYKIYNIIKETLLIMSRKTIDCYFDKNRYDFNRILSILESISTEIHCFNKDGKDLPKYDCHSILIGGTLMSRGYTFEQLITCIMLNVPEGKQFADTLMQRARWFGYRQKNERTDFDMYKYMKIYLNSKTLEAYKECQILNNIVMNSNDIEEVKDRIREAKFNYINPTGKKVHE